MEDNSYVKLKKKYIELEMSRTETFMQHKKYRR